MATWQWNNFILAGTGETLRTFAKEHDIFIYPYDILTASDIAMYENIKSKDHKERFIVCAVDDMMKKESKNGTTIYQITTWARMSDWNSYSAETYEVAIELWNKRMKETAQKLLKPPLRRFFSIEYTAIVKNLFAWGFVFFIVSLNNDVFYFLRDHYILVFSIFTLLCSNVKNIFVRSYGEEIPRDILRGWANVSTYKFNDNFYEDAMYQWSTLRELCENSVPIYLLWKRGKLQKIEATAGVPVVEAPDKTKDATYKIYCQEIKDALHLQIIEINDLRTKVSDKAVKHYVEDILKILKETQQAISVTENSHKTLSARRIVSYWNDKTISLINNYIKLLNNSSDEATNTKCNIEQVLRDLYPVYKKELGNITKTDTMEIDATITVMRNEIDHVLNRRI